MFSDPTTEEDGGTARPLAPEFPPTLEWVNVRDALRLEALRGRVVVLYFWTYSNIHAIQALEDLKYLEGKYRDSFALIGVHVPKFAQERTAANVMRAINRHYIRHPVVSDPGFELQRLHEVEALPGYVVLDAEGRVAAKLGGEGRRAELDAIVAGLVDEVGWQEEPPAPLQTTARREPRTA